MTLVNQIESVAWESSGRPIRLQKILSKQWPPERNWNQIFGYVIHSRTKTNTILQTSHQAYLIFPSIESRKIMLDILNVVRFTLYFNATQSHERFILSPCQDMTMTWLVFGFNMTILFAALPFVFAALSFTYVVVNCDTACPLARLLTACM